MSIGFLLDQTMMLKQTFTSTQSAMNRLCQERWEASCSDLPTHFNLEPVRCPAHNLRSLEQVYNIPDDNEYMIDVLGDVAVLSTEELRRICYDALRTTSESDNKLERDHQRPSVIWFLLDARHQGCLGALFLSRTSTGYVLDRLWVSQYHLGTDEQRTNVGGASTTCVHECLLGLVIRWADYRGFELQLRMRPALEVMAFTVGILGFMEDDERMTRLNPAFVMESLAMERAVIRQVSNLIHTRHRSVGDSKILALTPDTPESTETHGPSKT